MHWPKGMPEPRLYHKDLGFPPDMVLPPTDLWLHYTGHALYAASQEGIQARDLPTRLPASFQVVEVEMLGDLTTKWVLRWRFTAEDDLVVVILRDGTVKTVWVNHVEDTHRTLQRHRYTTVSAAIRKYPNG